MPQCGCLGPKVPWGLHDVLGNVRIDVSAHIQILHKNTSLSVALTKYHNNDIEGFQPEWCISTLYHA